MSIKIPSHIAVDNNNQNKILSSTMVRLSDVDAPMSRRVKSRILRISRQILSPTDISESDIFDWTSSPMPTREMNLASDLASFPDGYVRSRRMQVDGGHEEDQKQTQECEYFSLRPVDTHRASSADLDEELEYGNGSCSLSLTDKHERESIGISQASSGSVETCSDRSEEVFHIEDTSDILPPYHEMIWQMFYRFCGISPCSTSRQLQSRDDFEQLLKCLGMEDFFGDFVVWFPKPTTMENNRGYISLKMFFDLFSGKFAQTILEKQ